MMARSTALQAKAGYIDARPHLPDRRNLLAPHGRSIHWGQTEKNPVRAYAFRFALELGHCSIRSARLKRAGSRRVQRTARVPPRAKAEVISRSVRLANGSLAITLPRS